MKTEATFTTEEVVALFSWRSSTRKRNPYRLHNFLDGKKDWNVRKVDGCHPETIAKRQEALVSSLCFKKVWKYQAIKALLELQRAIDSKNGHSFAERMTTRSYNRYLKNVIKHVGKNIRVFRG